MDNYIVRIVHPKWTEYAVDTTARGLGEPYDFTGSPVEIKLSKEILDIKRAALVQEREIWKQLSNKTDGRISITSLRPQKNTPLAEFLSELFTTPGDSTRAKYRRLFGRRMYRYLFPLVAPTDAAIGEYWAGFSKLGSLGDYEKNKKAIEILDNYIALIDAIYALTPDLSRLEEEPVSPLDDPKLVPTTRTNKPFAFDYITIGRAEVALLPSIVDTLTSLIDAKTNNFFDPTREYKTFVNFGNGQQYLVEAWRQGADVSSVQLKLNQPLDTSIAEFDVASISRDLLISIVDTTQVELAPEVDNTPYLRPPNMEVVYATNNQTISEVTINSLGISTGSIGVISGSTISYEDRVFNRWYTADFDSSELNIDFTDYTNFIHYGSATARLAAFKNKLIKIESLAVTASISGSNIGQSKKAIEIETIKRNFDAYEQFLYYATNSIAYSASAYWADNTDGVEYNSSATWPKTADGTVQSTYNITASNWFATQSAIATRYDANNINYLVRHLPSHIQDDTESAEFLTFVAMFGHVMDNLKVYVDQFPYIYSTLPDPLEELSMDQVYEVATSIGIKLPNAYAIESLNNFVGNTLSEDSRISLAETWKRMLHSAIYLAKTKGTRKSVDGIMNVYGINTPVIQLKETSYPSTSDFLQSDELVYGLLFTSSTAQNVRIPFVSSSITASTIQVRFLPDTKVSSSILTADSRWAVYITAHPSASGIEYAPLVSQSRGQYTITTNNTLGRIEIVSGANKALIATSSYFPLFTEDYTNIMLTSRSAELSIIQTDGDQILHSEVVPTNMTFLWNATHVYLGGSGSLKSNTNFDGVVDEVRVWGEEISYESFVKQAYDPGSYHGETYTSSYTTLYSDLAFSQPLPSITSSATNESPYASVSLISLPAVGFTTASYRKSVRTVKQFVPVAGSTVYSSNKIEVAPPPVFTDAALDENGVYTLSRTNSIKPLRDKKYTGGQDIVMFSVSPVDFVNQTIMRTMGVVNVNYLIGSPRKIENGSYTELDDMYQYYLQYYNKQVNANEYIRFYKNAIKGPTEQVRDTIPARAKLIDGIVIESPILHRTKNNITKAVRVDGTNTNTFLMFTDSASYEPTSSLVGAYDFDATYLLYPERDTSTISAADEVYQYLDNHTLVTSSVISDNSGIAFINANAISPSPIPTSSYDYYESTLEYISPTVTQSGYPRNPFLGVQNAIDSEVNTLIPFYDIKPVVDFVDVGTTTYFHLSSGIYKFPSRISKYSKQFYKAQFIADYASVVDQLYVPITLMSTGSRVLPSRDSAYLPQSAIGTQTTIRLANLFSIISVEGNAGLQVSLTRVSDNQLVFSALLDGTPTIFPVSLVNSDGGLLQCTITNVSATSITSGVTFNYYAYEPIETTPRGYLPRHYKFYKNTGVAQYRRNISGCKVVYCPEGCPDGVVATDDTSPVQLTLSTTSGVVVNNPTTTQGSVPSPIGGVVTFGGGGILDA